MTFDYFVSILVKAKAIKMNQKKVDMVILYSSSMSINTPMAMLLVSIWWSDITQDWPLNKYELQKKHS